MTDFNDVYDVDFHQDSILSGRTQQACEYIANNTLVVKASPLRFSVKETINQLSISFCVETSTSSTTMTKTAFRFTHYDLKELRAGTIIEVSLNAVNNVRLMTAGNFQRFTEMLDFKYHGGVAKKSPIRLSIPETGIWHIIVDEEGHHGLAESSVKMLPAPSAHAQQRKAS